jgi:hypothetical protein
MSRGGGSNVSNPVGRSAEMPAVFFISEIACASAT